MRGDDSPARRAEKLSKISDVLVARIDRLEETRGSAWSMFQAAVALEQEVHLRSRELERALQALSERNRELAVARAHAEEANRSKTRFLRAASHDLLQPLAAAKLFLAALTDTPMDDLQRELSDRLSGAFDSVEELMHAVLDISRLDSQRIELQRRPVDLGDLLRRLATEYAHVAEAKGLRLRIARTSAVVESDPVFLRRIAQNLLSNAIKYTDKGGVLVGVRRRAGRAWLEVIDTGIGITQTDQARVFDEFQRVGREGGPPGMGLGLSIVRRACAKLDHPIEMHSRPGCGTVFRVGLPWAAAAGDMGRDHMNMGGIGGTGPGAAGPPGAPSLRGRVALVIENDHALRRGYELMLQDRLGMVARVTGGLTEALAQMGDEPPDLVIADYNLDNGETGLTAIGALRAAAGREVPAIIVTARRDGDMRGACLEMGVPVLEKPLRPDDLMAVLRRMFT